MSAAGVAYCITNNANGKIYIGISRNTGVRWSGHRSKARHGSTLALHRAIRKYGLDNFSFETIASARTIDDLKAVECLLIANHGSLAPYGYNLTSGGDGVRGVAQETRGKMRLAKIGNVASAATCAIMSASHKGRPKSEEHRRNAAAAQIGRVSKYRGVPRTPETIAKLKAAHKGRRPSEKCLAAGRIGRKHTNETKAKISAGGLARYARERTAAI